jgi:hypothetical protein
MDCKIKLAFGLAAVSFVGYGALKYLNVFHPEKITTVMKSLPFQENKIVINVLYQCTEAFAYCKNKVLNLTEDLQQIHPSNFLNITFIGFGTCILLSIMSLREPIRENDSYETYRGEKRDIIWTGKYFEIREKHRF